ncbi:MAG: LuxR C-terminal-related transcriptional regulator [Candidatus Dormibacteraeota bacterium]|nr:LuxR C-terminal-related transcriptional regulator [Candidatus Dormibacteraeota bacterium]
MARPSHRSGNLPAEATTFVGRRHELGEIRKKLTTARLVSLVGPGGVGKTRLGLRIATDLARGFADGAWLVELAEVRDAALVTNSVLAALDLRDQAGANPLEILVPYLKDRQLLLLLDNCEHLLDAAAQLVTEVLRAAPGVRVVTTSREPLQVSGEHVMPVPPLELPLGDGEESVGQLRQNEAVMLFTERAAAASGAFELTTSNQATVVSICRRLDGLPLAIELAAVRTRALSAEQIHDRLSDRFALLTGGGRSALPRHQTLGMAIDWSYDLLTEVEQVLVRRLCVFAGRFTLEDVEAVCTSHEASAMDALATLSSLVDKSLVTKKDIGGVACYRLHETMREYAGAKVRDANEEGLLRDRCIEHYRTTCLRFAEQARYRLLEWLTWADLEIDNIRAILYECVARGDLARGLDIATSMRYYWITHGTTESTRWFDQLLASGEGSPTTLVRAYYLRGWLSLLKGDAATARPWIVRAIATARETGQRALLSESLSLAATIENVAGDTEAARRCLAEAEAMTPSLHDFPATIELVLSRAIHALFQGDMETAKAASSEGIRLSREAGDQYQVEAMLRNLGMIGMMTGDTNAAKSWYVEALQVARHIDNRLAQYYGLAVLGWHAANSGQPRAAAHLLGAAETLATQTGADIMGPSAPLLGQAKESTIAALGASAFEGEFNAGKQLSREAALQLALGESDGIGTQPADAFVAGPLAKREVEVGRLVAEGLSNKQIGARLFISERTVATHVSNIMNKLGLNSRAQIAVWMTSPS